ncbi:MAG: heme-copper oxidase subunit III, partial [Verrucomicrobiota bacterium]
TFLASDCMFFGALISTHLIYRLHPPAGGLDPKQIFSPELTSFSTFILLMSSLMMALAVTAIQKGNIKSCRWSLLTTIFFGMIFLGCQVYEFEHFVHDKKMTLSNSLLGTTFYTLTGTHGCHVAIGVLWLVLMYVRSFKISSSTSWLSHQLFHATTLIVMLLAVLKITLGLVHGLQTEPTIGAGIAHFFASKWDLVGIAVFLLSLSALFWFARPRGAVQFTEVNAIDVESMGLYWHFVDIVWIVIFTAVYLLEFL